TSHNFGNVTNTVTSLPFTFTVTNSGNATSAGVTFTVTGANAGSFAVTDGITGTPCDTVGGTTTLTPTASCTVNVTFTAGSPPGNKSANLNVSAGPGEGTPHAGLTGKSVGPHVTIVSVLPATIGPSGTAVVTWHAD